MFLIKLKVLGTKPTPSSLPAVSLGEEVVAIAPKNPKRYQDFFRCSAAVRSKGFLPTRRRSPAGAVAGVASGNIGDANPPRIINPPNFKLTKLLATLCWSIVRKNIMDSCMALDTWWIILILILKIVICSS
jgi:hypothetical protein